MSHPVRTGWLRAIFLSETALIDNNAEQFLGRQDFELRGAWRVAGRKYAQLLRLV
jgi:hypothetical protein